MFWSYENSQDLKSRPLLTAISVSYFNFYRLTAMRPLFYQINDHKLLLSTGCRSGFEPHMCVCLLFMEKLTKKAARFFTKGAGIKKLSWQKKSTPHHADDLVLKKNQPWLSSNSYNDKWPQWYASCYTHFA